jgi:sugar phosphate isomerase/epimerase
VNSISFMSANFLAQAAGYALTGGWGQGDRTTNAAFAPREQFAARFEALLSRVSAMGFQALDLWTAHLNPAWATAAHIASARELMAQHQMTVVSLAGGFGQTRAEFLSACRLAADLGAPLLGGGTPLLFNDQPFVAATLREHGLKLGYENHPERSGREVLAKLGDAHMDVIGVTVDTGCFATEGYDAAAAIRELAGRIVHVHLRDVAGPGQEDSCQLGAGAVPFLECLRALREQGYTGALSMEHEPETFDPTADCVASLARLRGWLGAGQSLATE